MAKNEAKRAKGTGCLIKRGSLYTARWVRDGKVYVRSTETSDKKEAAKKLAEFLEPFTFQKDAEKLSAIGKKIEGAEAHADALLPSLTISNTFKAYLDSTNRPDAGTRTMKNYESQFNRFIEWMDKHHQDVRELRAVTKEMACAFAVELGKTLTANSFNKYLVLFRRIWKVLNKHPEARLKLNPWDKDDIHPKIEKDHSRRELTIDELSGVIASVDGEMRLLFAIGIYCGLRLGDASCLKWGSVDLVRREIVLIPGKIARMKNPKPVQIPIHPTLFKLLFEVPHAQRKGYVLPELSGIYLKGKSKGATLSKRIQKVFHDCEIETGCKVDGYSRSGVEVGFHSLRHSFVSLSANAGVPMAVVQSLVGHSNQAMTRHYHHDDLKAVKAGVYALPDVTSSNSAALNVNSPESKLDGILAMLEGLSRAELAKVIKYSTKLKKESAV
jgi:integrase